MGTPAPPWLLAQERLYNDPGDIAGSCLTCPCLEIDIVRFERKVVVNRLSIVSFLTLALVCSAWGAERLPTDRLRREFLNPPDSAKPRVWWHWMNGNISHEGICRDLQWMHLIGLGGVQNFDAAIDTPTVVDQRLSYMSPKWNEEFRYAVKTADRLGLEFAIASAPGWSATGGPWVQPRDGMKKLVWNETQVEGGASMDETLPRPPSVIGPFQNLPSSKWSLGANRLRDQPQPVYADVAVVAYRTRTKEVSSEELHPSVTSSAGAVNAAFLSDGDFTTAIELPLGEKGSAAWLQMDFGVPQTFQSMSISLQGSRYLGDDLRFTIRYTTAELQCSDNGVDFRPVVSVENSIDVEQTAAFAPTTARYFRLLLPTPPSVEIPSALNGFFFPPQTLHKLAEFVLRSAPRTDRFEEKAGFFLTQPTQVAQLKTPAPVREAISPQDIVDLTSQVRPDGSVSWTPPPGHWTVLRIGYSLLGTSNHPASPEATGLEVDKLSRDAVRRYMDTYLGRYLSILGRGLMGGRGLRAIVLDSWEAGAQNWSDDLPAEFARRRGYSLLSWLPALTGRVIVSSEATEKFLWDFRRTLGEVLADNYYGEIAQSLRRHGLIHYGESHEVGRAFIGDGMDVKRDDDVPMGAMWATEDLETRQQGDADLRESASVAHLYGQNIVAAESMTALGSSSAAFAFAPEDLKPVADRELIDGLNRFVVHTSVHQPLIRPGPGLTLGPFGQWFTRNETWAESATPWIKYLTRSSYLLQQGHFVADVLYYYGQDANVTALYDKDLPLIPEGFAFDFANAGSLELLSVRNGMLVTKSGMRYRLLALDPRARLISLDVLKKLAQLVSAGATVAGARPLATPSLADNAEEFRSLTLALWGIENRKEHPYGLGRIINSSSVADGISDLKLEPDFSYQKSHENARVWFIHRHLKDGDIYFIANREDQDERFEARFRVTGRAAELWHPDTGTIEATSYSYNESETLVPLRLGPFESVFVVFRRPSPQREQHFSEPIQETLTTLNGPWQVHFQSDRGAPEQAHFATLESWTQNPDPGIRYFSGTASYETTLQVSPEWLRTGTRLTLDLGRVKNVAELLVNGKSVGIAWKRPFGFDVTEVLRPGINSLSIRVTNLWPNRLIGDRSSTSNPIAFTTYNPYTANSPLLESGLLGPVTISRVIGRHGQ